MTNPTSDLKAANFATVIGDIFAGASRLVAIRQRLSKVADVLFDPEIQSGVKGNLGEMGETGEGVGKSSSILQRLNDADKNLRAEINEIERLISTIESVL